MDEGTTGSLAELDLRAARAQRLSERRRAERRAREGLRKLVRRPMVGAVALFVIALGIVAPQTGITETRLAIAPSTPEPSPKCPLPATLRPAFVAAAHDAGLPLGLLVAMAQVESGVDQTARSHVGAVGLLQLMPSTAASLHLDPSQMKANVLAGAQYLRLMLSRYGSTELALAAYNAGPTAVDRAAGAPTVETIAYVTNVEQRMTSLTGCV